MGFYIGSIEPGLGVLDPFDVSYPALSYKKSALDVKISQSADDFKPGLVFGDATITDMAKTKDLFNDQEWMLAFGPYLRLCTVL